MNKLEAAEKMAEVLEKYLQGRGPTRGDLEDCLSTFQHAASAIGTVDSTRILPDGLTVSQVLEAMDHFATEGFATTIEYLTGRISANSTLTQLRQAVKP
ncbi:MAG: hypothetical protein U1D67_03530 [Dehalococcoidia bacterium]|nr:hypothetical protein [Dehalococcoidia bacterium]